MGYESRIFVVNVNRHKSTNGTWTYAEIIAEVNMSCMGSPRFWNLFKTEIDYTIYAENHDEDTNTDRYGDHIKSGKIEDIIAWLETEVEKEDYRRLKPLLGLLKGFDVKQWECLEVLHYGY